MRGVQWYNGISKILGTSGDGIRAGTMNTALIVAAQINDTVGGNFAAHVAAHFSARYDGIAPCEGSWKVGLHMWECLGQLAAMQPHTGQDQAAHNKPVMASKLACMR